MEMITVTAKTLDEAITKALIQLGTTSDNLEYTVIEKGSAGFLGFIGKKDVVIQAKKKKENFIDDDEDELEDNYEEDYDDEDGKEADPDEEFMKNTDAEETDTENEEE